MSRLESTVADAPGEHQRHRSRRRRERTAPEPAPSAGLSAEPTATAEPGATERSLRGLIASGTSLLSLDAALRARDASRPTEEDLAEAEAELAIVRRQYVPTESLPPGIRPARPRDRS